MHGAFVDGAFVDVGLVDGGGGGGGRARRRAGRYETVGAFGAGFGELSFVVSFVSDSGFDFSSIFVFACTLQSQCPTSTSKLSAIFYTNATSANISTNQSYARGIGVI